LFGREKNGILSIGLLHCVLDSNCAGDVFGRLCLLGYLLTLQRYGTSSSAIADSPRVANTVLSVVSFNNIITRAHSTIVRMLLRLQMRTIKMLFCCLRRNVEASCRKHLVVVSRHQQTPPLTVTRDKCHNFPRSHSTVLITPGGRSVDSTRWNDIQVKNRNFCLP